MTQSAWTTCIKTGFIIEMAILPVPLSPNTQAEVDIKSESPYSLYRLVPVPMREAIDNLLEKHPKLYPIDEDELLTILRHKNKYPTQVDNRLRMNLWLAYDRAHALGKRDILLTHVYGGVCVRQYFYGVILRNPHKLAWILTPPADWMASSEEALYFTTIRLREGLKAPLYDRYGKINTKLLEIYLKIHEQLSLRVIGAVPQKIMHAHASINSPTKATTPKEKMKELEQKINELKKRDKLAVEEKKDG